MLREALEVTKLEPQTPTTVSDANPVEQTTRASDIVGAIARKFGLTAQEEKVLMAASRGETKKEIAFALGITVRTVEYYWTQIFRKLRCTSQVAVMLMLFRCATDA